VLVGSRLREISLLLSLLASSASLSGCHKSQADKADTADAAPTKDSLRQSYEALKVQLNGLTTQFATLHKQVDALPPDLEGLSEARGRLFSAEEVLGVSNAKLTWLASQVDSAVQTQKPEDMQKVAKAIAATAKDMQQVDQVGLELTHKLSSLERTAVLLQKPADVRATTKSGP
jgi:uncharacterized protein YoxC